MLWGISVPWLKYLSLGNTPLLEALRSEFHIRKCNCKEPAKFRVSLWVPDGWARSLWYDSTCRKIQETRLERAIASTPLFWESQWCLQLFLIISRTQPETLIQRGWTRSHVAHLGETLLRTLFHTELRDHKHRHRFQAFRKKPMALGNCFLVYQNSDFAFYSVPTIGNISPLKQRKGRKSKNWSSLSSQQLEVTRNEEGTHTPAGFPVAEGTGW